MKKEVRIGIVSLVIFLGAWAGIRFLSGSDIFGRTNSYYVYYDNANGLQNASQVVIRGVKVGQVVDIAIAESDPTKVEVELAVSKDYQIPVDSKAKSFSASIMGGQAIEIIVGQSKEYIEPNGTIDSAVEVGMMDMVANEFGDIKEKLMVMVDNINTTLLSLNGLVDSNSATITSTVAHLNGVLADLEKSNIISNIDSFTGTLKQNGEKIDGIVTNVSNLTASIEEQQLGVKLTQSIESLNTLLANINSAEGTVGSLLNDKELYANLTQASDNLSLLLEDLKKNPKRYVHFSLFGGKAEKK